MLALTYCFSLLGGGQDLQNPGGSALMLGSCWHIFRSWAFSFRSWPVLKRFLHFLNSCWSFFFELMAATGSILEGLGRFLEPSQPHLSMIFDVSKQASQTCSSCNKTTVFAMFYRLRNMPHMSTKHVLSIAFKAFLDMVHGLLQKPLAGIHVLLFTTTLQRGGTCEAHPPPPEGRAERAR